MSEVMRCRHGVDIEFTKCERCVECLAYYTQGCIDTQRKSLAAPKPEACEAGWIDHDCPTDCTPAPIECEVGGCGACGAPCEPAPVEAQEHPHTALLRELLHEADLVTDGIDEPERASNHPYPNNWKAGLRRTADKVRLALRGDRSGK